MGETIATAVAHMTDQMGLYGDIPLQPADDPYNTPVVESVNCRMNIHSQRTAGTPVISYRLTYQITLNALHGLFQYLYTENHPVTAVTEVVDPGLTGTMMRVGVISIEPRLS